MNDDIRQQLQTFVFEIPLSRRPYTETRQIFSTNFLNFSKMDCHLNPYPLEPTRFFSLFTLLSRPTWKFLSTLIFVQTEKLARWPRENEKLTLFFFFFRYPPLEKISR